MSHNHVKDINECENGENDCSSDAICFNTEGSFECGCKKGFEGDGQLCFDINECSNEDQGSTHQSRSVLELGECHTAPQAVRGSLMKKITNVISMRFALISREHMTADVILDSKVMVLNVEM